MRRFVLDASISLSWFLDSPVHRFANRVKQMLLDGERAIVPAVWHLEMANGLVVSVRRKILTKTDAGVSLAYIESLFAVAIDSETDFVSMRQACTSAIDTGLSSYDAVYFDLARRRELPLATLDRRLRSASERAGVELLG